MSTNIKSNIQGSINFNILQPKKAIGFSQIDIQDLNDISLQLNIQPSSDPLLADHVLMSAEDIHIYLNGIDFTPEYRAALVTALSKRDRATVKSQYRKGIENWLTVFSKFNFNGIDIAQQRTVGDTLIAKTYAELLTKLGSRDQGYSGSLHIFNFLYSYIDLDPISFNTLIEKKYPGDATKKTVNDFIPIKLEISHGKLGPDGMSTSPNIRGQLNYLIDLIYENPLYDLMVTISDQIKEIKKNMETQRTMYYDKIVNSVQTLDLDSKQKFTDLNALVTKLQQDVTNVLPK
jgi:hypothetical protein